MSEVMDGEIRRWTARRNSALVLEIIPGKTTVAAASRQFDLTPAEGESWIEDDRSPSSCHFLATSEGMLHATI